MIKINVASSYKRFSHYNTAIMCGGFDEHDQQQYVVSAQGEKESRVTLEAPDAHHIDVILYITPQELPKGKNAEIADFPLFDVEVTIDGDNSQLYNDIHQVNVWGGAVINLNIKL